MSAGRILYLNARQAEYGAAGQMRLPRDYALACHFLRCGIVDRTRTLDQGFDYAVLDPIPPPAAGGPTFAEICDARGAEIVAHARAAGQEIAVLWSGGIDSTTALIAVVKAAAASGQLDRVRVQLSMASVHEYPGFFLRHIDGRLRVQPVSHPIAAALDPTLVNVTGEHGDQLFGSHLLESYVRRGLGAVDHREIMPLVLLERLGNPRHAVRVARYLAPVVAAAPTPIRSLFDCLWWLNFALKWQEVALRLAVFRGGEARAVFHSLHHFFRDDRFQAWALAATPGRPVPTWASYKETAKAYILRFTGDPLYARDKEKEDSLRNVLFDPGSTTAYRVVMREDFRPVVEAVELLAPAGAPYPIRLAPAIIGARLLSAVGRQ